MLSQEIGNANGSCYALQGKQERKAWSDPWQIQEDQIKLACILEASESTRPRMEESLPKYHEDHIAGKGHNSLQHYNLAMKIPAAKAAVDQEWEKLERILA